MSQNTSYKEIFRATSIFGGMQLFNILIAIIRSKVIAVLLGTAGMGLMGIFTSTTGLISSLTNFGLNTSAVKNVASAYASADDCRFSGTLRTFTTLAYGTALLGFVVTLLLSPLLSKITFGSTDYTVAFIFLSITVLLTQLCGAQNVILQATRKIKWMAKAGMLSALTSLIVCLPLYYFFHKEGIVPAIIGSSIIAFLFTFYFAKKIPFNKSKRSKTVLTPDAREMLKMGFLISLSSLISMGASFLIRVFINRTGKIDDVGLYVAGFTLISTYVGMVFNSMSTDYYPRLSSMSHDKVASENAINQQAEVALLILSPIVIVFLVFIKVGVILLYSKSFLPIVPMMQWAIMGIFFKAISWSIGFIFLAKGDSKIFFWNELSSTVYILILNIAGYYFFGLTGMGVAFFVSYLLHFAQMFLVSKKLYGLSIKSSLYKILFFNFLIAIASFICMHIFDMWFAYSIGTVLTLVSCTFSLFQLNKRIDFSKTQIFKKIKQAVNR